VITIVYARGTSPSAKAIRDALIEQGQEAQAVRVDMMRGAWDAGKLINWGCAGGLGGAINGNIRNGWDKYKARQLFAEHEVPAPTLFDAVTAKNYIAYGLGADRVIIARTRRHSRRSGYFKCRTPQDIGNAVRHGAVQFMAYIDAPREYRVHIINGKSYSLVEKQFLNDEHIDYTTVRADRERHGREIRKVREAAKQAVAAVGMDFGAVDVLVDNDGNPYVLEVNAAPGIGGTTGEVYAKAFIREYVESV
jgi:hypothetical protein